MAIDDLHDDEIKARLGIELGDDMEHRIEAHMVRAMPEEFDPDTEIDLSLLDLTSTTPSLPPLCSCPGARYAGDPGASDPRCPVHGPPSRPVEQHTCSLGCWRDCSRDCPCECHREGRNR